MAHGLRRTAFDQSSYDYWTGKYGVVNVKDFGAVGDGVHDDTAAIQAAINAVAAKGGGTVYFPNSKYIVNGKGSTTTSQVNNFAFVTTNGYNCLLALPYISTGTTEVPITIELRGDTYPAQEPSEFSLQKPLMVGAVIQTTLLGNGALPYASILGGPSVGLANNQTAITVVVRNLTFRQPSPAGLTAIDASGCVGAIMDGIICDVDAPLGSVSVPASDAGTGIWLPDSAGHSNYGMVVAEQCFIAGLGQALIFSAHAHIDKIIIQTCGHSLVADNGFHPAYIGYVNSEECTYDLTVRAASGPVPHLYVGLLDIEVGSGQTGSTRIYDPNNLLVGTLNYVMVEAGTGVVVESLPMTGASNLLIQQLSQYQFNLPGGGYAAYDANGTWINLGNNAGLFGVGFGGTNSIPLVASTAENTNFFPDVIAGDTVSQAPAGNAVRLGTKGNASAFRVHDSWVETNSVTTTLAGTTAGNIYWAQPERGTRKVFTAVADAYENDTTTDQTITFPVAYTYTPAVVINTTGLTVSATTTTLTITAPDATTTYSGVIEVVGI